MKNTAISKKLLFLCTGNSCRSIMAEVILNQQPKKSGKVNYTAYSAGSFPTGRVNPDSLAILHENQLPTEGLHSQSWHELSTIDFDIVITVCDNAAQESCPAYMGQAIKAHWGIADPDKISGNGRKPAFRQAFAQLQQRIDKLLALAADEINSENLNNIGKNSI
jgi:arsenate reductase